MLRPLVWVTVSLCIGIILANSIVMNFWIILSIAVMFLVFCIFFIGKVLVSTVILLVIFALSGALILINSQVLPQSHVSNFVYYKSEKFYSVKGNIVSVPEKSGEETVFIFNIRELHFGKLSYRSSGKIKVQVARGSGLYYGQGLILKGYMYPVPSFQQQKKNYLLQQGIYCIMRVESQDLAVSFQKTRGFSLKGFAFWLKSKMQKIISFYVPKLPASVLEAMVLGEKKDIPRIIYDSMVKAGTVHILVVSGFNVGIIIFIVALFLKLIRVPRKARFVIIIPCLIIYCLLTGASNPVVRATVMGIFFLVAYLIRREPDIYNSLSLAALFILLIDPGQLFNIGFQLSFASVISIIYLYPRLKTLFRLDDLKIKSLRFLAEGGVVSLSAWLGTSGFIAYYFKLVSPVTILANIFIVPLATFITLCGICLVFSGLILPPVAPYFASTSELAVTLLVRMNLFLSALPGASFNI
ncbi:MAG: ComEC/Rec2 family competence protein [Candidatus Omnitrophica bacterium]|nr:ComEC/Rec2 family competence protein [Candidatus Omnitrophota bacterium]